MLQEWFLIGYCMIFLLKTCIGSALALNFTCNEDGSIQNITGNIDPNKIRIQMSQDPLTFCTPNSLALNGKCNDSDIPIPNDIRLFYEIDSVTYKNIIGGNQMALYELKCEDHPGILSASANYTVFVPQTVSPSVNNVPIGLKLQLSTSETEIQAPGSAPVQIGKELYLFLSATENHVIDPQYCTAKSESKDHPEIDLWNTTSDTNCTNGDRSMIDSQWEPFNDNSLRIKMYAFRFTDSDTVTITCEARVCPDNDNSTCTRQCVNEQHPALSTETRRRRAIQTVSHVKEASATFTVSSPYKTNSVEGLFGNSLKRNLIVSFLVSVMFVLLR